MARDTDPASSAQLVRRFQVMSIAERAELTRRLCLDVDRMARAGIRAERPDASEADVACELTRRRYGDRLADEAYAREPGG